jgi:Alw26I/Eco31I/Esp3I family type II restriction m6 adenine DNA methyltransferase
MDKATAQKLVQQTLQGSFNKERFVYLVKNILNHIEEAPFTYKGNLIFDDFADSIRLVERIGKYHSPDEKLIDILIVHLARDTSLERARTKQRNFVAKYLKGSRGGVLKDAALVAFVAPNGDDWRFSLVKMEYKFKETPSGRVKVEEEFTPARRYSFLVGKNENSHTAQSRLLPLLLDDETPPTLEELENTFSVERVTKEFFEKYRDLFLRLKEALDEVVKKDSKVKKDFTDKNVCVTDFAKKLLGQIVFLYFLQKKGWFGVKRGEEWGSGSKHFLRELFEKKHGNYKNFFNDILEPLFYEALRLERPGDYYSRFNCRIPFLNGGLFDPINDYDWWNTDILLPDDIFSNDRKTKEGDTGDGILDIFDRYNFTVKEDEPLEKEVAVDPEMLGKVFENLLEVKDRKSKGTYYTPREIVHYMCQESLVNYLATELEEKVNKEDIETLIKYGETVVEHDSRVVSEGRETERYSFKLPESIRKHAKLIDEKLASIRVCDPAVGSGAFPVGMMNEIVRTRNALTPYIGKDGERTPYHFKRHAIQNCLYGVDIDPGAVEIAKLRLWLSLVVDEEERETIQPLPNLDYKIVQGNSLLGVNKNLFNADLFSELEKLKPLYFNETSASKKQAYKRQIDDLISRITNGHKEFDFEVYFSEVFHEKGGFDVVIANPPYDVYQGHRRGEIDEIRRYKIYDKATGGKLNAYKVFLAKSIELQKPNGVLCEIFQNSFLADNSASTIRKYFLQNQTISSIDSFPERDDVNLRVFENVKMSVCILNSYNMLSNKYDFVLRVWRDKFMSSSRQVIFSNLDILDIDPNNATIPSIDQEEFELLKRISKVNRLKTFAKCYEGEINLTFHKKFLKNKKNGYAPMIKGAAVQKWYLKEKMSQGEVEYLDYKTYLNENTGNKASHYKLRRIVMQGITGVDERYRLKMTVIEPGIFCANSVNYILINNPRVSDRYLLALLNSRLLNWFFKVFSTNSNVNGYEVDNLPIPDISVVRQKPYIDLVDKILAITKDSDYLENPTKQAKVKEYERQIDQLVYQLYGLTDEEIKIVEGGLL